MSVLVGVIFKIFFVGGGGGGVASRGTGHAVCYGHHGIVICINIFLCRSWLIIPQPSKLLHQLLYTCSSRRDSSSFRKIKFSVLQEYCNNLLAKATVDTAISNPSSQRAPSIMSSRIRPWRKKKLSHILNNISQFQPHYIIFKRFYHHAINFFLKWRNNTR